MLVDELLLDGLEVEEEEELGEELVVVEGRVEVE